MFMFRPPTMPLGYDDVVTRAITGRVTLIDVREPSELAQTGKAKGALHIPMGQLRERADPNHRHHHPKLQKDAPLALYCGSGGRAANAIRMLESMGYQNLQNIGSFDNWIDAGGTVVAT